jgi:hypothetical protein
MGAPKPAQVQKYGVFLHRKAETNKWRDEITNASAYADREF